MDCSQAKRLIDAYVDGELELAQTVELERHLAGCAACARAVESRKALRTALRSSGLAYSAPASLRRRIAAAAAPKPSVLSQWLAWRPLTLGACLAALALVMSNGALRWSSQNVLEQEVIAGHVRSLEANHLTDVLSTDKHTVKPWFAGKLDFSPAVQDLAAQGFPLVGGRLDYLDGHPVAALVYGRNKHRINVFEWPSTADKPEKVSSERGFNLVRWSRGGMTYWLVSDLNKQELSQLADLIRAGQ